MNAKTNAGAARRTKSVPAFHRKHRRTRLERSWIICTEKLLPDCGRVGKQLPTLGSRVRAGNQQSAELQPRGSRPWKACARNVGERRQSCAQFLLGTGAVTAVTQSESKIVVCQRGVSAGFADVVLRTQQRFAIPYHGAGGILLSSSRLAQPVPDRSIVHGAAFFVCLLNLTQFRFGLIEP